MRYLLALYALLFALTACVVSTRRAPEPKPVLAPDRCTSDVDCNVGKLPSVEGTR
jgi:hypothetical protein